MLRLYIPLVFAILFAGWTAYRLFVRKDLRKNLNDLYAGLFFSGAWALIYYALIHR